MPRREAQSKRPVDGAARLLILRQVLEINAPSLLKAPLRHDFILDAEGWVDARLRRVGIQQALAERMDRRYLCPVQRRQRFRDGCLACRVFLPRGLESCTNAVAQFGGGLLRECNGHNSLNRPSAQNKRHDAVYQSACLARARSRLYKKRIPERCTYQLACGAVFRLVVLRCQPMPPPTRLSRLFATARQPGPLLLPPSLYRADGSRFGRSHNNGSSRTSRKTPRPHLRPPGRTPP